MTQLLSISPTKTKPKTISHGPQPSTLPLTIQNILQRSSTVTSQTPEKSAAKTPVEIGTRGTVGALILQEIEHFSRLELGSQNNSQKPSCQRSISKPKLWSIVVTPKKKKGGSNRFIPSMCSLVEVAETKQNQPKMISKFNYKNLKTDVQQ